MAYHSRGVHSMRKSREAGKKESTMKEKGEGLPAKSSRVLSCKTAEVIYGIPGSTVTLIGDPTQ